MQKKKLTPLKAIRAKCLDCCGSHKEVKLCTCEDCTLYPYRFGKNPNFSKETREKRSQQALNSKFYQKKQAVTHH